MVMINNIKILSIPTWNGKGMSREYERWNILMKLKLKKKGLKRL